MPRVCTQNHKQVCNLTEKLGEGGEGSVFAWPSGTARVCKIYHDHVLQTRGDVLARKLAVMIASPPHDPQRATVRPAFLWPQEIVFSADRDRRFLGFTMPRLRDTYPLHQLYSADDRRRLPFLKTGSERPLPEYDFMVTAARNLAETFHLLHSHGYVMADVNEDNIRFRNDGTVSLIDVDSFQVHDLESASTFLSPVMKAEYWPADSLERHAAGLTLTSAHDDFGLAVFIFRLLMNGVHPFHAMATGSADPPSLAQNIAAGRFPFAPDHSGGLRPPPYAPAYASLPTELQEFFQRCFLAGTRSPSARPQAGEWIDTLEQARSTLQGCHQGHRYFAEARHCPWCALEERLISCPKGHRYYREERQCHQCRLEQRRDQHRLTLPASRAVRTAAMPTLPHSLPVPGQIPYPALTPPPVAPPKPPRTPSLLSKAVQRLRAYWLGRLLCTLLILLLNRYVVVCGMCLLLWFRVEHPDRFESLYERIVHPPAHLTPVRRGDCYFNPKDNAEVIWIPAGSFQMGSEEEAWMRNPPRRVTLSGYWIYKNLVTEGQYKKYIAAMQAAGKSITMPYPYPTDPTWSHDERPMIYVTREEVLGYCAWAGVDLPTEAEWEKAALWDDSKKARRRFPWGNDFDAAKIWCGHDTPTAAGQYGLSFYGCTDMDGNVEQWCKDKYQPQNSPNFTTYVVRGSSYSRTCGSVAARWGRAPDEMSGDRGFRCAAAP